MYFPLSSHPDLFSVHRNCDTEFGHLGGLFIRLPGRLRSSWD